LPQIIKPSKRITSAIEMSSAEAGQVFDAVNNIVTREREREREKETAH
jgi:hypothetical protein